MVKKPTKAHIKVSPERAEAAERLWEHLNNVDLDQCGLSPAEIEDMQLVCERLARGAIAGRPPNRFRQGFNADVAATVQTLIDEGCRPEQAYNVVADYLAQRGIYIDIGKTYRASQYYKPKP
jgi:hypothetical protein